MTDQTPTVIAARVNSLLPNVKAGTLRFWGQWFGRPHDNCHRVVGAQATEDTLVIRFDSDERLTVVNPRGAVVTVSQFTIRCADKIIWEWFYCGRPHTPDNLYREEYTKEGTDIRAASTVDWCVPALCPSATFNAVEIL